MKSRLQVVAHTLLFALALLLPLGSFADERILSFDSEILVAADGGMRVTESIRVRAEGNQIRRGIFRDFPTDYRDRVGNRYRVGFEVISVRRDGAAEPYRTERIANGIRVYIGSADVFLQPDEYQYELTYDTSRQLGFFDDHDELYWNVTGNGWDFPIDRASAQVRLSNVVPSAEFAIEAYVGPMGSNEHSYVASVTGGVASVAATRPLNPREGLTLVASWPKGFVEEPTAIDRGANLLIDNVGLLVALASFFAASAYLFLAWRKVGRDPEPGVIFPHYQPPEEFSPAAMRYVTRMGYDAKAFTAAILNLAVKGYLEIDEEDEVYTLRATRPIEKALAPGEAELRKELFKNSTTVELKNTNHSVMRKAMRAHGKVLNRHLNRVYFMTNSVLVVPAVFVLGIAFAAVFLLAQITVSVVLVLVPAVLTVVVFFFLLRAPTPLGRRLLDKIEGFKLYLEVAEKEELALRDPPEKTPALFESYLPYALALGVEHAWAEKFSSIFERLKDETGTTYQPRWYHGDWHGSGYGGSVRGLTAMTGSLGSAISSASTPPGSSSGGGGGGSSGGGGGGGGGGGW